MSAISQKSISGITSITTPAGIDDQLTLHTSDTSQAAKLDGAGNFHFSNHVNTTGITSASNFKTGSSNLHSTGLTVGDTFVHSTGINIGSNIKFGSTGVITATSFVGDGSDLTNLPAGLGTALSATATSPLNKMYYTNAVLGIAATTTVDVPASASAAYTQYADINIATDADLIIADGDDLIPDVLGLADFGTFGGGTAGRLRVSSISNHTANGAPTVQHGLVITGVTTSTTFSGSGASLTNLNASNIASGTVPTARLGSGTANSSTFLAGDSTFKTVTGTTINNNADNRVITGSGTANTLEGESQLLFTGTNLGVGNRTSSPDERLHVHTSSGQANIHVEGATDGQIILRAHSGDSVIHLGDASATSVGKILYDHGTDSLQFNTNSNERLRIDSNGNLSFAGDTDTYIHHPEDNELAITCSGGSFPIVRFGTGGSNSTVGFSTDTTLVTNSERIAVRGFSSFKSTSNVYAAIYTHNEGNTSGTYNAHLLWNAGGANRGGIGYMPNNGEVIFNNQNPINFATGATNLGGTTRLRIDNNGYVTTPTQCSFRATKSGGPFNTGGGIVVWDQNQHNIGSNYNTSNGRFTAPIDGTYIFTYYSIYTGNSNNDLWDFRKNGSTFAGSRMHLTSGSVGGSWDNVVNTQILTLSANDYVDVYATDQGLHGGDWTHFCGHLLG